MLVLSRRPGERILIGEGVVLTFVAVRGKRVHIGIEAPEDVSIRRRELEDVAHEEQELQAASRRRPR